VTATLRRGPLHIGKPKAPDCPLGTCRWCGEPITLVDPADYRRARRRYHYGDEHEEDEKDCLSLWKGSVVWDARSVVRAREREAHGLVACVDCGAVCENANPMDGHGAVPWEADHQIPLEDGGPHHADNLHCRCVPCHRAKTAREATERAARRRATRSTQPQLEAV
jgi:hypothetical protein